MFKKFVYPVILAGSGIFYNSTHCEKYKKYEEKWKVADDNKILFTGYSYVEHTRSVYNNCVSTEDEIIKKLNDEAAYLCRMKCNYNDENPGCKVSKFYELTKDKGVFIPEGLDKDTKARMIVAQDLKRFKDMEQTDNLCRFVLQKWPKEITNVKKPSLKCFKWAIAADENVYPLIEKLVSKKDLKYLVQTNGNVIKYLNDPSFYEVAINNNAFSIQYIKNPSEKLQKIAIEKSWNSLRYIDNPTDSACALAYVKNSRSINHMKKIPDRVIKMMLKEDFRNIRRIPLNKQTYTVLEFWNCWKFNGVYRENFINKSLFSEKNILKLISKEKSNNMFDLCSNFNSIDIKMTPMIYRALIEKSPNVISVLPINFEGVKDVEDKLYSKHPELRSVIDKRRQKR